MKYSLNKLVDLMSCSLKYTSKKILGIYLESIYFQYTSFNSPENVVILESVILD